MAERMPKRDISWHQSIDYNHRPFGRVDAMKCTRDHERWISRLRGNGFSQKEIGDMLGLSQQVVAYNLGQMKKRFKKKYAELFEGDDQWVQDLEAETKLFP